MPRIRRMGIAAVMTAAMLVVGAPAFATEPLTPSGYVTDSDGFLSDEQRANIETRAESLDSKYSVPVYIAIVPNFSDQEPAKWCQSTLANIEHNDKVILYVVGYEDGTDVYCVGNEMARLIRGNVLTEGYIKSALSAARRAYKSTPLTPEEAAAGPTAFISDLSNSYYTAEEIASRREAYNQDLTKETKYDKIKTVLAFLGVGFLFVIGIFFELWTKQREEEKQAVEIETAAWRISRRRDEREDKAAQRDADRAVQQASDRLSQADQEVRDAEKEWDYARAQFGIAATEQFRNRIKAAKEALSRGDALLKQCHATYNPATKKSLASQMVSDLDTHLGLLRDAQAPFSTKRSERTALPTRLTEAQERLTEELAPARYWLHSRTIPTRPRRCSPLRAAPLSPPRQSLTRTPNSQLPQSILPNEHSSWPTTKRTRSSRQNSIWITSRIGLALPSRPSLRTLRRLTTSRPTRPCSLPSSPMLAGRSHGHRRPLFTTTIRSTRSSTRAPRKPS